MCVVMTLSPARDGCKAECGNSINNNANIRWLSQDLKKKKDLFSSITYHYDSLFTWILQQYFIFLCVKSCVQNFYIVLRINITNISTSSLFTSAGCTWWSLTLSCHHSGTFTPPLFLTHLCCITPSSSSLLVYYITSSYLCLQSDHQTPRGAPSQGPQVVARAGLLPHELAHLSLSRVPRHQAGQETFGAGGDALASTSVDHVLCAGPRGPRGLAPG